MLLNLLQERLTQIVVDKAALSVYRKVTLKVSFSGLVRTVQGAHVYVASIR